MQGGKTKIFLLLAGIILLSGFILLSFYSPPFKNLILSGQAAGDLRVSFLDVGQGDAVLIESPYGQNILLDGGPDFSVISELGRALPWWERTIDLMILSHPHDDHVYGLVEVLRRYRVKRVLYSGVVHASPGYLAWLSEIKERNIELIIVDKPQSIYLGDDCRLDLLYPRHDLAGQEVENLNNSSLVARLVHGQNAFLLTGDIEAEAEAELLESGAELGSKVYKAGHHGSDTSNTEEFLAAASPEVAVITAGADNGFGHPSRRVLKRLERLHSRIYRTDKDGTIRILSDGQDLEIAVLGKEYEALY